MRVKIYHANQIKKMKDQSDKAIPNKKKVCDTFQNRLTIENQQKLLSQKDH